VAEALRACEILLATQGFAVVVLDLADGVARDHAARGVAVWPRLSRHAVGSGAALVVLGRDRQAEGAAHLGLVLSAQRAAWPKHRLRPPVFCGIETRAEVVRARRSVAGNHRRLAFGIRCS
jgi:predicted RecA/RadA family phage recombinase